MFGTLFEGKPYEGCRNATFTLDGVHTDDKTYKMAKDVFVLVIEHR